MKHWWDDNLFSIMWVIFMTGFLFGLIVGAVIK